MANSKTNLMDLPNECLLLICDYLDCKDLVNLSYVCRTFESLIEHKAKNMTKNMLMVSHLPESITNKRSCHNFTYIDRLKMGTNWMNANYYYKSYKPLVYLSLYLDKEFLYANFRSFIVRLRRHFDIYPYCGALECNINYKYLTNCCSNITDFSLKENTLFEVRTTGEAHIHENTSYKKIQLYPSTAFILCCDFHNDLYVAATDSVMKMWKRIEDHHSEDFDLEPMYTVSRGYRAVLCNKDVIFACGFGYLDMLDAESLHVKTLDKSQEFYQLINKQERSVLALSSKSLCLFDERSQYAAVKVYAENNMSRFDYDGINGVVLATGNSGDLKLLDLRKLNSCVCTYHSSYRVAGVNGLACDTRYVFGTWNQSLNVFDFKKTF